MVMRETLTLASDAGSWWMAVLAIGLAALVLWGAYRRSALPPRWRWICAGLKFAILALLALLWLDPARVRREAKPGTNDFVILVDNGEGMKVHEGRDLPAQLAAAMEGPDSWFGRLEEWFHLDTFAFGERLVKTDSVELNGRRSDLGGALDGIRRRYAQRPLAGILLFSDGNATDRARLASIDPGVPVFPVVIGSAPTAPDIALTGLAVTESGFEDAPVSVSVQGAVSGLAGQTCRIQILDPTGKEMAQERIKVTGSTQRFSSRLRFRGAASGVSAYRVVVSQEGKGLPELTDRNNSREFIVDMGRGDLRVLYIAGRPNWEHKFLHRALERDEEIHLTGLIRLAKREPKFEWRGRAGETSNPLFRGFQGEAAEGDTTYDKPVLQRLNIRDPAELRDGFPKEREELFPAYDAIILDDLEAGFFTGEQLNLLESFVGRRGGGLLMLGGQESLQLGSYERTPMERLLPVYLGGGSGVGDSAPFSFRLTREGFLEPWVRLRLTEVEEEQRIGQLPSFRSFNQIGSVKPGAAILAQAVAESGEESPALAVQTFGEGRVGALMVADLWRWGMEDPAQRKDMEAWWRQVVRWLVADVPGFVEVTPSSVGDDEPAMRRLEVVVKNSSWRAEDNATVSLEVSQPGQDAVPVKLFAEPDLEQAGRFTAEFTAPAPGAWQAKAVVTGPDGKNLGEATAGWAWTPAADEFASLTPDRPLLEELARRTGGRIVTWNGLGEFAREASRMEVPVAETIRGPAWHHPGWFVLLILLVAGEWGIRRWKGLA